MTKKSDLEVPGNVLASQAAVERYVMEAGRAWVRCVDMMMRWANDGLVVYRITWRGSFRSGDVVLLVLAAEQDGRPVVAFHEVTDPGTAWQSLYNRCRAGKLKWKDDQYAT